MPTIYLLANTTIDEITIQHPCAMKTAILHIGTEKTGTTTVQEFLVLNSEKLEAAGIGIPSFLGKFNHQWLPNIFPEVSMDPSFFRRLDIEDDVQTRSNLKREEIYTKVCKSKINRWIFSSEHLQSTLNAKGVQKLADFLYSIFDEIKILVYLRDPISLAVSRWSTQLKCGSLVKSLPKPDDPRTRLICDYKATISTYAAHFGEDSIVIRRFDKSTFYGSDLLKDFCNATQIEIEDLVMPSLTNESLGAKGMKMLINIIPRLPDIMNRKNYFRFKEIVSFVEGYDAEKLRYMPSQQEINEYKSYFKESNEWVRTRYFQNENQLWPSSVMANSDRYKFDIKLDPKEAALCDAIVDIFCQNINQNSEDIKLIDLLQDLLCS